MIRVALPRSIRTQQKKLACDHQESKKNLTTTASLTNVEEQQNEMMLHFALRVDNSLTNFALE